MQTDLSPTDTAAPLPTGPEPAVATRRPRCRWRRWLLVALALVLVGGAALVLRLQAGPVFSTHAGGRVASALASALGGGASASVGVVGLALTDDFAPEFHVRDLRLTRPVSGSVSVDTATVTTDWATVFGGPIRIAAVAADHVVVETEPTDAAMPPVADILTGLDGAVTANRVDALSIAALTVYRKAGTIRRRIVDAAHLTMARDDDTSVDATLDGKGVFGAWTVAAALAPAGAGRSIDLSASGFDVLDLALVAGEAEVAATGPVEIAARMTYADGLVTAADGVVTVGPLMAVGVGGSPLLDRSRLDLHYDAANRRVVVDPSSVVMAAGHAVVRGEVRLPDGAGALFPFRFEADAREDSSPAAARALGLLVGSYDFAGQTLVVDTLRASGEGAVFTAAMQLSHGGGHVTAGLSGVFQTMSVAALKAIWPAAVEHNARKWVAKNVLSGQIHNATVDIAVADSRIGGDAGGAASATVAFAFTDLVFTPIDNGPPIREAIGVGRLFDNKFEVTVESGRIDLGDRSLAIKGARFLIPTILQDPPDGEATVEMEGSAAAALALWNTLPLADDVRLPASPEETTGKAKASIRARMPLINDLKAEQVDFAGTIDFSDLAFSRPVEGRRFDNGKLRITLADGLAGISGTADLDGVGATIDLTRRLTGDGPVPDASVKLLLDADDRKKLGIDFGDAIDGAITVAVTGETRPDGSEIQRIAADLTAAAIRVRPLGLTKAAGKPGKVSFVLGKSGERTVIDDLKLDLGLARADGRIVLDSRGEVISADLPRFRIRAADRLAAKAVREDGVLKVTVTGDRLDARGIVREAFRGRGGGKPGAMAMEIDLAVAAVIGHGEETFGGVNVALRLADGQVVAMAATAQSAGGGAAALTVTPADGQRRLEVEIGEVGRLLRFLDIYDRVNGGRARVAGVFDDDGLLTARVDGSRWRIVDEPALARLATAVETGAALPQETVEIDRLLMDLRLLDGRLTIDDGVVRASSAGLSIQGDVDLSAGTVNLAGTYLPASAFDSLLGRIPLLGQTVFAGGRAGILGVTFQLTGPMGDAALSINPLSVIAPGIFRKLFEAK